MVFSRSNFSSNLFLAGLCVAAIALPFSNFLMSVSQFMLAAAWLAGGGYQIKFNRFFQNKPAVIFSSFYLLHLLGMIYTSDMNAGINDLRVKLPLLVVPFVFAAMPAISANSFRNILRAFVASVLLQTVLVSINSAWIFISPVRFSMMVSFSIFILLQLSFSQNGKWKKFIAAVFALWLAAFLAQFPYDTGIVTFACALFVFAFLKIFHAKSNAVKVIFILAMPAFLISFSLFIYSGVKDFYGEIPKNAVMPEFTVAGEKYAHYPERKEIENGSYVWRDIAWTELENAWNKRSAIIFKGNDRSDQPLHVTLIRFLTSKGLKKDAEGVSSLSSEEVHAIESGIANIRYLDGLSLSDRLYETIWSVYQYQIGNSPQGNSIAQRF